MNSMDKYPKQVKKHLRQLAAIAHERELREQLEILFLKFVDWKNNKLDTADLEQLIHEFHNGAARELYKRYNYLSADMSVAYAVARGLISEADIPEEIREAIEGIIKFFKDQLAE